MALVLSRIGRVVCLGTLVISLVPGCSRSTSQATPPRKPEAPSVVPRIDDVNHLGVQRGVATELTIRGARLSGNPRLVAPFRFTEANQGGRPSDPISFTTRVTVDPETALGVYPVRVLTDDGFSDPFPMAVGQLPVVREVEGKHTPETAPLYTTPVVIEGRLSGMKDHGTFRFRGKRGRRILMDPQFARIGSRFDPSIFMLSMDRTSRWAAGVPLGYQADDPIFAVLPQDADYFLDVRADFHPTKGGRPDYRLVVGELPAAREVYPLGGHRGETIRVELRGGTLAQPMSVPVRMDAAPGESVVRVRAPTGQRGPDGTPLDVEALPPLVVDDLPERLEPAAPDAPPLRAFPPVVLNGRIEPAGVDRFLLDVAPVQRLRVEVAANDLGSALNPTLKVLDARGKVLADPDGEMVPARGSVSTYYSYDPAAEFTVPAGQTEIVLEISGRLGISDEEPQDDLIGSPYRVKVVPVVPGFELWLGDAQVSVPRGGAAAIGVTGNRRGFAGPIALRVSDPPPWLSVRPGVIAEGQTVGAFTVAAAADAVPGPVVLDVIGEGRGPAGPILARAKWIIAFGPLTTAPHRRENLDGFVSDVGAYLRTRVMTQSGLFAAAVRPAPLALDAPAGPIDVVRGRGAMFKVTATRLKGAEGALTLRPLPLPSGLSIPEVTLGATATEAAVTVKTAAEHPLGEVSVVLMARGTIAGAERFLAVPAVTLKVIPPADAEPATPSKR
jgi:hypothetical protein